MSTRPKPPGMSIGISASPELVQCILPQHLAYSRQADEAITKAASPSGLRQSNFAYLSDGESVFDVSGISNPPFEAPK